MAGNHTYFSYASNGGHSYDLGETPWLPEYDYPLGEPLGEAKASPDNRTFSRAFASGTTVRLDLRTRSAHIAWARRSRG